MSEQEHTPGPWLTVKSKPNRVRDESGVIIAQVSMPPTKLDKASWMKGKEISHANARLIAAAPELLAALKALDERGHTQATWSLALKAIAKAECRSHFQSA